MKKNTAPATPTVKNYNQMQVAYDFFNEKLFDGTLPQCLVTMQGSRKFAGYFAPKRFKAIVGREITDEICMNPELFAKREPIEVLSTLVHEQVHLWQAHFGKQSRMGYHNKEWGAKMEEIGLMPSATGEPGGKKTGQSMTHYIIDGGAFQKHAKALLADGGYFHYASVWSDEETKKKKAKKAASKSKFVCEECGQACWGKPDLHVNCADCDEPMKIELGGGD